MPQLSRPVLLGLIILPVVYGGSFWHWQRSLAAEVVLAPPIVEVVSHRAKPNYAELAQLFGAATPEMVAAPIEESTLPLKLVASYVGREGHSAAVISISEGNHELYYQSSELLPGVELVEVQARRVLIKLNGVLESVSLADD